MPVTDFTSVVGKWFDSLEDVSGDTLARIRAKVQQKMDAGACRDLIPLLPVEYRTGAELQACVEQAIEDDWDTLTPDERLLIRFPTTRKIGEKVELPNRGVGTLIRRELTKRFGILLTFRLEDGSLFTHEFFD
jgi:hypothetical protein